jgi:hypothetical protein
VLETGEIEALIPANTSQRVLDDSPRVRRLLSRAAGRGLVASARTGMLSTYS